MTGIQTLTSPLFLTLECVYRVAQVHARQTCRKSDAWLAARTESAGDVARVSSRIEHLVRAGLVRRTIAGDQVRELRVTMRGLRSLADYRRKRKMERPASKTAAQPARELEILRGIRVTPRQVETALHLLYASIPANFTRVFIQPLCLRSENGFLAASPLHPDVPVALREKYASYVLAAVEQARFPETEALYSGEVSPAVRPDFVRAQSSVRLRAKSPGRYN